MPLLPIPARDLTTFYLSPGIPSQYFTFLGSFKPVSLAFVETLRSWFGRHGHVTSFQEQTTHQWLSGSTVLLQDTLGPLGDSGSFPLL